MGLDGARTAARQTARAVSSAGRASAGAARRTSRAVQRMTGASGARRSGLASLMELTAVGTAGDAFVTIALAGTLLARGLLCWGMADAVLHNDVVALLPAAFGVLVLQKAYAVIRASVTPRLLPREITLVTANSRTGMASLVAGSVAGLLALGISALAGGGASGAAWALRVGTLVYIAATAMSFRVPDHVDQLDPKPAKGDPAQAATVPTAGPPGAGGHPGRGPGG